MSGRHVQSAGGGRVRIWLAGVGVALIAVLIAAFAGPADASSKTIAAQLSLSGLASADNPVGGSQIGIRPGDKVTFAAAGAPTAGLTKLGLGGLADGPLGLGAKFQITADFSKLPGGRKNTVLSGATKKAISFPRRGTYSFTWTAQKVTVLGLVPINLDGNQLAKAGVKLNASNAYVGKVVVATHPPAGGLSVQLPTVNVAPSAPVVGQLPTISIPGVNLPTAQLTVPDLNPGSTAPGGSGGGGTGATKSTGAGPTTSSGPDFSPPAVSVPEMVLGGIGGGGGSSSGGSAGGGGFRLGVVGSGSRLAVGGTGSGGSSSSAADTGNGGSPKTVDLASSPSSPTGQLPVLLAILAVITLAMVAGIYARLYLLGRRSASS